MWGTAAPFDFDVSNCAGGTIGSSALFLGRGNVTLGSSMTCAGSFTLASGSRVIVNGANMDGSTINGDCELLTETDLTNVTINGDLRINTGANTVLNFDNVRVTGNVFNDSPSNTLTINGTNGTQLTTTEPGTGNGQVQIVINNTVTFTGLAAGGEFRIYDEDLDGNEITIGIDREGVETLASGTYVFTHSATESGNLIRAQFIFPDVYVEQVKTVTLSASDQTINLELAREENT